MLAFPESGKTSLHRGKHVSNVAFLCAAPLPPTQACCVAFGGPSTGCSVLCSRTVGWYQARCFREVDPAVLEGCSQVQPGLPKLELQLLFWPVPSTVLQPSATTGWSNLRILVQLRTCHPLLKNLERKLPLRTQAGGHLVRNGQYGEVVSPSPWASILCNSSLSQHQRFVFPL